MLNHYFEPPRIRLKSATDFPTIFDVNIEGEEENFILKEINICKSIHLSEPMINNNFDCEYLNKSNHCFFENKNLKMIFEKAEHDCLNFKNKEIKSYKRFIYGIILAIYFLHKYRILHGDIKCENILVKNNKILMADFGMSAFILKGETQSFPENTLMYTPSHRAPEVWETNTWGFSADIWSLGCTLYEFIYNEPYIKVFDNKEDYIHNIYNNKSKFTESNEKYNVLIKKMLHLNPKKRPTITEIIEDTLFAKFTYTPFNLTKSWTNKNKSLKASIIDNLEVENTPEIIDLIASLYEDICKDKKINENLVRLSCLIITNIVYKTHIDLDPNEIKDLNRISHNILFNYINYMKLYKKTD